MSDRLAQRFRNPHGPAMHLALRLRWVELFKTTLYTGQLLYIWNKDHISQHLSGGNFHPTAIS